MMDISMLNIAHEQVGESRLLAAKTAIGGAGEKHPKIREAAESFEAIFLAQMMAPMFGDIEGEGAFGGGGQSEEIYHSMMVDHMSAETAKGGGIGIADHVYKQLLALQEV